jgi:hypothetical protein
MCVCDNINLTYSTEMRLGSKLQEMGWDLGNGENKLLYLSCKTLWPVLKKRTVHVIHVELNISRSNNLANSDMQVNTVHDGLSIAKFALCWLAACHYLQNIITEPKNKII